MEGLRNLTIQHFFPSITQQTSDERNKGEEKAMKQYIKNGEKEQRNKKFLKQSASKDLTLKRKRRERKGRKQGDEITKME